MISPYTTFDNSSEVLPYYVGARASARRLEAQAYLYWEVMRRAGERGCRVFDYGRSYQGTGAYAFKKNWGFAPSALNYQWRAVGARDLPDINPLNPKYRLAARGSRQPARPLLGRGIEDGRVGEVACRNALAQGNRARGAAAEFEDVGDFLLGVTAA